MSIKRFKWFNLVRFIGVVMFVVIITRTDLRELGNRLREVDGRWLSLAIVFQLFVLFIKAWRWYIINEQGFILKNIWQRAGEFFEGYAIGVITPGRMGELMKAGHAGTRTGIMNTGLKVIAERGFDFSIFTAVSGTALTWGILPGASIYWGLLVLTLGIVGIIISLLIFTSPKAVVLSEQLLKKVRLLKADQSMTFQSRKAGNMTAIVLLTLLGNLSYFLCCYCLAMGVGMYMPVLFLWGGVALAGLINTLPITVMGLGTRELTFLYVFYSFSRAQVLVFSGLVFLVGQVGGGILAMILGQGCLMMAKRVKGER